MVRVRVKLIYTAKIYNMNVNVVEFVENLHAGTTLPKFTRMLIAQTKPQNVRVNLETIATAWHNVAKEYEELSDGIAAAYHYIVYCMTEDDEIKLTAEIRWAKFVAK